MATTSKTIFAEGVVLPAITTGDERPSFTCNFSIGNAADKNDVSFELSALTIIPRPFADTCSLSTPVSGADKDLQAERSPTTTSNFESNAGLILSTAICGMLTYSRLNLPLLILVRTANP